MTEPRYGWYTIIRAMGDCPDELTNVGVLLFDAEGQQVAFRLDRLDRAFARGDLQGDDRMRQHLDASLAAMPAQFPTRGHVERALERTGHAMSYLQVRQPLPTLLRDPQTDVDGLFAHFCLGKGG